MSGEEAQVEFMAVIARLFQRHRIKAVLQLGETIEEVERRIFEVLEDSSLKVTIKMKHSERARFAWEQA
jgi:hypothetical protein